MDPKKSNDPNTPTRNLTGESSSRLLTRIKTEPGVSLSASTRLTSYRVPRDLTLSGNIKAEKPNKKVYLPNVNVQRNKTKEDVPATTKSDVGPARGRGRGRGRGQSDRGRGRGKPSNVTQSSGVFSEGISAASRARRGGAGGGQSSGGSDREPRAALERPKLNLNQVIDKADEEEKVKQLLRDDFIDDGTDADIENAPIALPLIDEVKLYKNESSEKKETMIRDENIDEKPIILESGEAVAPAKHMSQKKIQSQESSKGDRLGQSIPEIVDNYSNSYTIFRFPDCLPGLQREDDTPDPRTKREEKPVENEPKNEYCTLGDLKSGFLGKIQIHRSGKARLILGDNSLVVDVGSRLGFRQDVVAVKLHETGGDLINLGQISNTLICTPDFESILATL